MRVNRFLTTHLRGVRPEVPFNAVVRCWEVPCELDLYDGVALQLADDDVGVLWWLGWGRRVRDCCVGLRLIAVVQYPYF